MEMSKTTLTGILTIIGGLVSYAIAFLAGHGSDLAIVTGVLTAITTGIGLIKAADATP
jgi:hypothetical protein